VADSIGQIANEAKAILEDIRTNTLGTRNNTSQIINDLQAGFSNLATGLGVLIQLESQANQLAAANNAQNNTIICWLGNIAHVLCDIKHDLDESLGEQHQMSTRLETIGAVLELVHAREAMEVASRSRLQEKIDACCPPERPEPAPCFEECAAPETPPYRPIKVEWKSISWQQTEAPK
jgi:hypothetical protein